MTSSAAPGAKRTSSSFCCPASLGPSALVAFDAVFGQTQAKDQPAVWAYFRTTPAPAGTAGQPDRSNAFALQDRISALAFGQAVYHDAEDLKQRFGQILDQVAAGSASESTSGLTAKAPGDATYGAALGGGGAVAQGPGATAVGAGAVLVQGDNTGSINVTVQADKAPPSVPFQAPAPAPDHVPRPAELAQIKQHFLAVDGHLLPATIGLHGFGGAGKTILARLFCADAPVRQACRDGILWVPLGKNPPDPRAQIADLVTALTGECGGCSTLPGARAQLQAALANRTVLLVLDDVWDEAHIKDLAAASAGSARLITTRNTDTLPFEATLIDVATMHEEDAVKILQAGLPGGQDLRMAALATLLGCWPILLRLANRTLRQRSLRQHMPLPKALDVVERDLARKGVLAFDPARETIERDQAVRATVEASLDLLSADERQCYAELAIFPQDVPVPLACAAELWQLTAGLSADEAEALIASRLEPLSLLDYNGATAAVYLHDVLRSYLCTALDDRASLHRRLAEHWGDRPANKQGYAWRWLAFHRAQAAKFSAQPEQHPLTEALVALVTQEEWQDSHEQAIADLPALREALSTGLAAAAADDDPRGLPLVVRAADALVEFGGRHQRPEPIFTLARSGDLPGAKRRADLFFLDEHWRQALLLTIAWLAPPSRRNEARALCDEVRATLAPQAALQNLLAWVRAELGGDPPPVFPGPGPSQAADERLIEELLKRVGGGDYNGELIRSRGLDPDVQDPDQPPPTRGIYRDRVPATADGESNETQTKTGYLAELDGPYLVAYAAKEPTKGMEALERYLSVYTNYNYPEYRFSTLWLLLQFVVTYPRADGGAWVKDAVVRILGSALGGGSVEFQQGLPIAALALRAQAEDPVARQALIDQAHGLIERAARLTGGRERSSDVWAHHKRRMLASAQALGWLLGEHELALRLLQQALRLADSGFAGYQAPACLALADTIRVCAPGDPQAEANIDQALQWAQRAAHNVQDPTFCARMTARVNALRHYWWQGFDLDERVRQFPGAAHRPEFAALHRVGHAYAGRRMDALQFPHWASDDQSFDALQRLYQRPKSDFLRLNGGERPLHPGDEVAVPDPGFIPHLAARLAAEMLAEAGDAPWSAEELGRLRALVPHAVPSPTALDAVLTRLVLAHGRRDTAPDLAEVVALEAVLARRPPEHLEEGTPPELTVTQVPGRLPS